MGEHSTKTQVTFECGHKWLFPAPVPKMGEILWCMKCRKESVVKFALDEFRIRCEGCTYSRPFGAARLGAEIAAAKHRQRFPGHVVRLLNGCEVVKRFGENRYQTVIPVGDSRIDDVPGF